MEKCLLYLKYGLKTPNNTPKNNQTADEVLQQTQQILNQTQQLFMQSYVQPKFYNDKKAPVNLLVVNDYCCALQPKAHSQTTKLQFPEYLWTGPYIVVKSLPNNYYLVRKLLSNLTQILHWIRLRPLHANKRLPSIAVSPKGFQHDTEVTVIIKHDDPYAMAWQEIYKEHKLQQTDFQTIISDLVDMTPQPISLKVNPNHRIPDPLQEPQGTMRKISENQLSQINLVKLKQSHYSQNRPGNPRTIFDEHQV